MFLCSVALFGAFKIWNIHRYWTINMDKDGMVPILTRIIFSVNKTETLWFEAKLMTLKDFMSRERSPTLEDICPWLYMETEKVSLRAQL